MKRLLKPFVRTVIGLTTLFLIAAGLALVLLGSWSANKVSGLDATSKIAPTKSGPVEFQTRGKGPAVLVLHGGFGGFDQGMIFIPGLAEAGFQVIAPSRPGYLRTPLATGETNEQQADAMAALLDTLKVRDAAVLGISAGGPVAIQFALRHPDRTRALVLVCAVTQRSNPKIVERHLLARWALHSRTLADFGSWYGEKLLQDDPRKALELSSKMWSLAPSKQRTAMIDGLLRDPGQIVQFRQLAESTVPLGARLPGIRNDSKQMTELADLPFSQIQVPTFIIHGTADKAVKVADARLAASRIPQGTLCELEGSGHLLMLGPHGSEAKQKILDFLRAYSSDTALR